MSFVDQFKDEFEFTAVRSRGPGGQNVNKVSSASQLKWAYLYSPVLSDWQKQRISRFLENSINKQGEIYLRSDEFRDLERNRSRCLEKLDEMLKKAFHRPKPRKKTRPTQGSVKKRLDSKKRRGEIKKNRQTYRED